MNEEDPPANQAPTASAGAGANMSGNTGDTLALAGSATDPDGDPLTYEWSIESGPAGGGTLTNASSASAQFSATLAGTYVLSLIVRDAGSASPPSRITITITAPAAASVTVDRPSLFLTAVGQDGCTVTPTTFTIGPEDTENNLLLINYSQTPATYGATGEFSRQVNVACPDDDPKSLQVVIMYMGGTGELSDDGLSFEYDLQISPLHISYRFTRP